MDIKLAIILPVFKNHVLLPEAVNSILAQTDIDGFIFDLVIVDDGSADSDRVWNRILEVERMVRTESANINVIKLKKLRNDGPSVARNYAISNTDANWIGYLDVDDLLYTDHIKNFLQQMNEFTPDADLILFNYYQCTGRDEFTKELISPKSLVDSLRQPPKIVSQTHRLSDSIGIMHSRELYNRMGGWPPFLLADEDAVFVRRLSEASKGTVLTDKVAGIKRSFFRSQGTTKRRFDSGLYINLDTLDILGPTGQYLDEAEMHLYFVNTAEDPEFAKRNQAQYMDTLVNARAMGC